MFSYRNLFKQAWQTTWRHKYLWFFGLFASLTAAGGSVEYQIITNNFNRNLVDGSYNHLSGLINWSNFANNFLSGFGQLFSYDVLTIINVFTLLILIAIFLAVIIWLAVCSQAALIDSVKKLWEPKKKPAILSIREGLANGHKHFWSVLGLNVFIRILVNVAFFIIGLPLLFLVISDYQIFNIAYVILFVIFIPIAVSLSLMVKYAIAYRVLENRSVISSLEKGWHLFMKNWLISLEMAVSLFIVNFLTGLGMLLIMAILVLPLFLVGTLYGLGWLVIIMLFLAVAIIVFVGSALITFQISTWTSLFLRLKDKGGLAKLERIFQRTKKTK